MNLYKLLLLAMGLAFGGYTDSSAAVLRYHTLAVDSQNKIIPWFTPTANAFDNYLDKCWAWASSAPNDVHGLPISFLYCAWNPGNPPTANTAGKMMWVRRSPIGSKARVCIINIQGIWRP